jgi:aminopeptidase N
MSIAPSRHPAALLLALLSACAGGGGTRTVEPARPLRPDTLEHNGWDRDADLLHVHLDLAFRPEASRVGGTVTSRFRGLREEVKELTLHALGLEVLEVTDGDGRTLRHRLEEPRLLVELAEPLVRGEEVSVAVRYSAEPEAGLFFRESSRHADGPAPQFWTQGQPEDHRRWLPIWDYPNDRATLSADLRAPAGFEVLSNGDLREVVEHPGGERTFRWRLEQRVPTYLIAVAGGAWETYADEHRGLPVLYHVGPGTGEERARRAFGETPAMLAWMEQRLGVRYPYPRYAQVAVADFTAGGMENASLTLQHEFVLCSADEAPELDGEDRLLVAHELAHQWFGDLVTCLGWSHLWLNEAWASYLEVLWEAEVLGPEALALRLEEYRGAYLSRGEATRRPLSEDWRTQLTDARCSHEYVKGPWVLAMLEREVGSADFWRAVTLYLERHADDLVTTSDLARCVFDATGRNVEGFLEQWVEAGGHPEYEVRLSTEPDALRLRVRQRQRTSELVPLFDAMIELEVHDDAGVRTERVRVDDAEEELVLPLVGELRDLVFDAPCAVLCALDLEKPLAMWRRQALEGTPAQRYRALDALLPAAGEGSAEALEVLREVARGDREARVRRRALAAFSPRSHGAFLLERLEAEPDPLARVELLEALARRRLPDTTVAALERRFGELDSRRVRTALDRLRAHGERAAAGAAR